MTQFTVPQLKAANAKRLLHPMANLASMRASPPDIIVKGDGSWIWDVDGHKLVDGVGGL